MKHSGLRLRGENPNGCETMYFRSLGRLRPYAIVTATGGRSGTFSGVSFSGPTFTVNYNSNDVMLTGGPTAVRARSFTAGRSGRGTLLHWRMGSEAGLLG